MVLHIDATTKSRARAAMRRMVARAEGPRLGSGARKVSARGLARAAIGVALLAAGLALAAVIGFAVLLARGPIDLAGLHDEIAASLQERAGPGYRVTLGPTFLTHEDGAIGLGFGGITIRDFAGRPVVAAPSGKLALDPLALLVLQVKVRRLELDSLDLNLHVGEDGALSIAAAGDSTAAPILLPSLAAGDANGPATVGALIYGGVEAMAGASQALDRLSLAHGHFVIDNAATRRRVVYDDFSVDFSRSGESATVALTARGASGPLRIDARADGGAARGLSLEASGLGFDDFRLFDRRQPPFTSDAPIGFAFESRLTREGAVDSFAGHFTLGAGHVLVDDPDAEPFLIDEATGAVNWNAAEGRYDLDQIQLLAGATRLEGAGWLRPPEGADEAWTTHFESRGAQVSAERPGDRPVALDRIVADARVFPADGKFSLDRLALRGPTVRADLSGETAPQGDGATLKLALDVGPSLVVDVVRLWPQFVSREVRDWCAQNLRAGKVTSGAVRVDWDAAMRDAATHKRAVPADSVHGEFAVTDVGADLLPGLPPLAGVDASGTFTGHEVTIAARRGVMELSGGRRIQASEIVFTVPDTTPAPIVAANATARLQASADSLADILGRDALKRFVGLALDPGGVKGQFDGRLALDLELGKSAKPDDTGFRAEGALTGFQFDKFMANDKLEQATLNVAADRSGFKIVGDGQVFGAPTHIDIARATGEEGLATLTFAMDAAARARRGLAFGPWFSGVAQVKMKAPLTRASAEVEIDLARVGIDNPIPGLVKPVGKPGKATFLIKPDEDGVALSNINVEAGALSLKGAAQIGADGALQSVKLTQARLSPGDDLKVEVVNSPTLVKWTAHGASLDARPLVQALLQHGFGPGAGAKDLDLDFKIASVVGANKQTVGALEVAASRRAGAFSAMQARGRIGQGVLSASLDRNGDLRLHTTDAGALIRFADLYSRMEGGVIDVVARDAGEGSEASATVTNFVLRDEPAIRQLIAAGQARAATPGGTGGVDPGAARFQKMTVSLVKTPGRVDIKDAIIYDEQMGLTTQGAIDFARGQIDVGGTFIPAYAVNTLLTNIPVVGTILGGGKGEGLFGVNYRVHGPLSGPTLTVNPLSAIAPGILRKIIGVVDGTTAPPAGEADAAPPPTRSPEK